MRRSFCFAVLVGAAITLAACGSDNSSKASSAATSVTSAPAVATTAASTSAPTSSAVATTSATTAAGAAAAQPQCAAVGNISAATTTVNYNLSEFKIDGPATAKAGTVGFALDNIGKAAHEFRVIKAANFDALPKDASGGVDQSQLPSGAEVGVVQRFNFGTTCSGTFALQPGNYVLVCNIEFKNGATVIAHAARGMHLDFQVTS